MPGRHPRLLAHFAGKCAAAPAIGVAMPHGERLALVLHTELTAMLSRITACCLAVLVLLPFTAPFATCDVGALFGARAHHLPLNRSAATTVTSDANVANVPAIARIGRVRLLQASNTGGSSAADAPKAPITHRQTTAVSHGLRERAVLATILRL